jgi:hypothetical protein
MDAGPSPTLVKSWINDLQAAVVLWRIDHDFQTVFPVLTNLLLTLDADRGNPAVPVEFYKEEYARRGIRKHVQLTMSGCIGPCPMLNVAWSRNLMPSLLTTMQPSGRIGIFLPRTR